VVELYTQKYWGKKKDEEEIIWNLDAHISDKSYGLGGQLKGLLP